MTNEYGPPEGSTDRVWLSALRRGVAHHTIDGRHTTCRRYIGETPGIEFEPGVKLATHGWVMPLNHAMNVYATRPCARCYGTADIVTPTVTPSRDRRSA